MEENKETWGQAEKRSAYNADGTTGSYPVNTTAAFASKYAPTTALDSLNGICTVVHFAN